MSNIISFRGQKITKELLFLFLIGMVVSLSSRYVYADLTKQDIEEIRKIVKEEVQKLETSVNKRIDDVNKRIDDVNKRIDDLDTSVNRRIGDLRGLLYVILAGIFTLIGFVMWDRRTTLAPVAKKTNILEEKEERLERALKEFALKEPRLAEALRYAGVM